MVGGNSDTIVFDLDLHSVTADQAPVIRIAFAIIQQAIREGAVDIHIEPREADIQILHGVDGVSVCKLTLPTHIKSPLTRRFKIMAGVDPFKPGLTQQGRFSIKSGGKIHQVHAAFTPTAYGDKIDFHMAAR